MLGILQVLKKERKKKVHYISCGLAEPGHTKQNKGKRVMPYQALPGVSLVPHRHCISCSPVLSSPGLPIYGFFPENGLGPGNHLLIQPKWE